MACNKGKIDMPTIVMCVFNTKLFLICHLFLFLFNYIPVYIFHGLEMVDFSVINFK